MTPPKPVRPDQYSPDATPQATELTPGERRAPVLQGTEDIAAPLKKPAAATPASTATVDAAKGDSSEPGTAAKKSVTATGSTIAPGTKTALPDDRDQAGDRNCIRRCEHGRHVSNCCKASEADEWNRAAEWQSASPAESSRPATGSASGSTSSASAAGSNAAGTLPKTKVIVDGPIRETRPADSRDTQPESSPGAAPVKKKGPEIVPDDGSRPPGTEKPAVQKPKPAVQPSGQDSQPAPATPKRGR